MKKLLLQAMYRSGAFAPFHWANRDKVVILMYHGFSHETHPHKIAADEFASHLDHLGRYHRVLPLSDVIEMLQNEKTLPPNTAVITIDDGYADAYDIAFPLLKEKQMPATVYAVTDFLDGKCWLWTDLMRYMLSETKSETISVEFDDERVETALQDAVQRLETAGQINSRLKKMPDDLKNKKIAEIARSLAVGIPEKPVGDFRPITWEQAREMDAQNVRIESHTLRHPILTNIAAAELEFELTRSKQRLEEMLDRPVGNFCYPNGSFNENIRKAVERAGYQSATTTNYGFNITKTDRFALNRIDARAAIANFAQSVSGFETFRSVTKL